MLEQTPQCSSDCVQSGWRHLTSFVFFACVVSSSIAPGDQQGGLPLRRGMHSSFAWEHTKEKPLKWVAQMVPSWQKGKMSLSGKDRILSRRFHYFSERFNVRLHCSTASPEWQLVALKLMTQEGGTNRRCSSDAHSVWVNERSVIVAPKLVKVTLLRDFLKISVAMYVCHGKCRAGNKRTEDGPS